MFQVFRKLLPCKQFRDNDKRMETELTISSGTVWCLFGGKWRVIVAYRIKYATGTCLNEILKFRQDLLFHSSSILVAYFYYHIKHT